MHKNVSIVTPPTDASKRIVARLPGFDACRSRHHGNYFRHSNYRIPTPPFAACFDPLSSGFFPLFRDVKTR
jgi:hypothetical protein